MVLSNKKLKQKLRAAMAESLTASEAAQTQSAIDTHHSKSQIPNSLTSLLDSATQKPRLSKREKRRKAPNLQGSEVVGVAETEDKDKENGGSDGMSIRKKKRKREERSEAGVVESGETVAAKKLKKKKKKNKKVKKVVKEEVKKIVKEEVKKGDEGGDKAIQKNHSQENVDAVTKAYVGGIPYYSTEDDIRSFFDACGTITEVDCMTFPDSGKFRGIAIINFKTEAAAKRALALDGADMGGLFLKVQPYKSTRVSKVSDFAPSVVEGYNRIYAGNLSWDITEEDLRQFFSGCSISSLRFGEDKETGEFRGYAHVDFADSLSLNMALKMDQKIVCGRPVRIRCAVPRKVPETKSKPMRTSNIADNGAPMSNTFDNGEPPSNTAENGDPPSNMVDNGGDSAVSGKIRRRTCYECGEKGHLSSACPKKIADNGAPPSNTAENGDPPSNTAENGDPPSNMVDNGGDSAVSGKIRRRTCYECGEKGHLSSACPKMIADNGAPRSNMADDGEAPSNVANNIEAPSNVADNCGASTVSGKIRRRTCYECGEKGHLSSSCPKKQTTDVLKFSSS